MYSVSDLQKLVQMLAYLGIIGPGSYPPHSVVLGAGANAAPGAAGTLLASNGISVDPSFQTLAALGIQTALGYTPAHAGANSDITSIIGLTTALAINQGGTGAITAALARAALGAAASGANTDITSLNAPALGAATATTPARGTNTNEVATAAFVANHSPIPNILDFGGDPTGVSDNSSALAAALASGPTGRVAVYFPPGTYAFSAAFTYIFANSSASLTILGAGPDVTNLLWAAGGGLKINFLGPFNSVHLRDFSILTASVGTGNGLWLNQTNSSIAAPANSAASDVQNVTIRGSDGYVLADYWATALAITYVSNINFYNVFISGPAPSSGGYTTAGNGALIQGISTANGVVYNFDGCTFNYIGIGLNLGAYVQGVAVQSCNFTGGQQGVGVGVGQAGNDQLYIAGNQFNNAGYGVVTGTHFDNTLITGNLFIVPGGATGIYLQNYNSFSVSANAFNSAGGAGSNNGIVIDQINGGIGGVVTGNSITGMTGNGVQLTANSQRVNVQSNAYIANGTNVLNSGVGNTVGGGSP